MANIFYIFQATSELIFQNGLVLLFDVFLRCRTAATHTLDKFVQTAFELIFYITCICNLILSFLNAFLNQQT